MAGTIPVILSIDCEPDAREIPRGERPPWVGFETMLPAMSRWRGVLAEATGRPVRFVWAIRTDPGIAHVYGDAAWAFGHYREALAELAAEGDEIGLHVHPWRWDETEGRWIADYADEAWTDSCLRTAHEAATRVLGRPIRCARIGDRIMNNTMMRTMESLAITYDLTLEPGQPPRQAMKDGEQTRGQVPDQRRLRRKPYQPSRGDFRRRGWLFPRRLWFIPITTGTPLGHVHGMANEIPECQTILLGAPFEAVRPVIETALHDRHQPYLAAVCRTDVRLDPFNCEQFDRTLDFLATHPMRRRFAFETPAAVVKRAG